MAFNAKVLLLKAVRLYTYNTPIAKGKYRAFLAFSKMFPAIPNDVEVSTPDGRRFAVDLATGMQTTVFFLGEYEKAITNIIEGIIREKGCKTFLDVGANFGWYTTLFNKYAGNGGAVHSFEPVPSIYENLKRNYELMRSPANVAINNLALGDEEKEITINLFEGLSTGHASISDQHREDAIAFKAKMITLDSYLEANNVPDIDLVKVDIEGAEMMFLKGAERLFAQKVPPIWLMEMALQQTKNFGYTPNDLIQFIGSRAEYDFFKIDEPTSTLIAIEGFADDDIGANVICMPKSLHRAGGSPN